MKKLLIVIFTFLSMNLFAQINVKKDSFRKIDGFVMLDKYEHTDVNNSPMALIKITTENISSEQRTKFKFNGNLETYFEKQHKEDGQIYLYISAEAATFIEIIHPEYGKVEYRLPFDLCGFCGYEMVIQYVPLVPVTNETAVNKKAYLIVQSDQDNALVYIDNDTQGVQSARKLVDIGTSHTYRIECNMYYEENGSVTVNDKTVVDKKMRPNFGYINISSGPEQGAKAWVDGDYVGVTPIKTDKLKSGTHTIRVMKDMYKMEEQSFVVEDGQTTNAVLKMLANFVNLTVNVDSDSDADIYVDEEYKGKGKWTGRLSDGAHILEARKNNHRTSSKNVNLVLGNAENITLDAPEPINGMLDIDSSPMGAAIYIDGKHCGETPNYIADMLIGVHELRLTKQGCTELKKTIIIKEGETLTINEKLQTGKEITITTDKAGDKVYVDGSYLGASPVVSNLSYGTHTIKAERNGKTISKNISVVQGGESKVELKFLGNETITVNGVSFTMIAVEGGTFQMGATSEQGSDAGSNEKPVHSVTLSDYYIGETEVTQELWTAVMGNNPSYCKGNKKPVENVSWNDCQEFVKNLSQLTGKNFRLPTEAEWEYAARGGNKSKGYKYSGSNTIGNVAWYDVYGGAHDVKTKQANELGIYDMSGNIWEWCQDWYGSYNSSFQTNPKGPSSGSNRVFRGGGWHYGAEYCRVSDRGRNSPGDRYIDVGFRVVCLP